MSADQSNNRASTSLDPSTAELQSLVQRLDPAKLVKGEGKAKALLIGCYKSGQERQACEDHLDELAGLCDTFGLEPLQRLACPLRAIDASTYLGSGKVEEIAALVREQCLDLCVMDEEILPSQQRNLERSLRVPVLDRAEVILGVFAQRAQTKEARLQVELAQAKLQLPRLRRLWTHLGRQSGGGGGPQRGEGEKQIELDKRMLRSRIERLEREMKKVQQHRAVQRAARERHGPPSFAIVGYTNAGKSTLINALTDAGVLAEDKLFATLDTTTRKFTLPNHQDILLTDTVGFIRKLPHQLIEAFRSTLEEALFSDILIHVVDASHPDAVNQANTTIDVIKQLGGADKPMLTVLNKVDLPAAANNVTRLRLMLPRCLQISALNKTGFEDLFEAIEMSISSLRTLLKLRIPLTDYAAISKIHQEHGQIVSQIYEDSDVLVECEVPKAAAMQWQQYLAAGQEGLESPPKDPWDD